MSLICCPRLATEELEAEGALSGKDYVAKKTNVTFASGERGPKFVEIEIIDDEIVEPYEYFQVRFMSSSVPAVKLGETAGITIEDNDGNVACATHDRGCICIHCSSIY